MMYISKMTPRERSLYNTLTILREVKETTASLRDTFEDADFDLWLSYCDMEVNIRRIIDELENSL